LHQQTGLVALANLPNRARWFPQGDAATSATKRSRESQPSQLEGFSMSAHIVDFKEEKNRREHRQLMRAKYAALMLTEMLLADEAEALVAHPEVQEDLAPKQPRTLMRR
jgi:hypothetical protein